MFWGKNLEFWGQTSRKSWGKIALDTEGENVSGVQRKGQGITFLVPALQFS